MKIRTGRGCLMTKRKKILFSKSSLLFYVLSYTIITLGVIITLVPLLLILSASFSSDLAIRVQGFSFIPIDFNVRSYELIFRFPGQLIRAFGVSIFITAIGTFMSLILISMTAYVISRRYFKYRNRIALFFFFTTLFNGGLLSTYVFYVRYLHLKDNLLALILPLMFNVFYLLIMRSFAAAIPSETTESAKIDGAGEFRIFLQIAIPLLPSGLAAIGLLTALHYWNDWFNSMLFIVSMEKYPLQYLLHYTLNRSSALAQIAALGGVMVEHPTSNTLKMAMVVIATAPVILAYPFMQRYFIKGIIIASVKS